ncbi:polycystic kidney disease protein 1-like 2 [Anneissia japonica]|uniref:polycystic kidney disease protein 1-like 2 n=1 Tax=Anneissia japonica TaxID=1529436 RepID=UPI001425AE97|nr:polycystic kidney disease protein 1-like 2 [Anneissia japonica]
MYLMLKITLWIYAFVASPSSSRSSSSSSTTDYQNGAPTTEAPTTEAPTTEAPTTEALTTVPLAIEQLTSEPAGESCYHPLGVEGGNILPDQLSASSEKRANLEAHRGRLNTVDDGLGKGGWAPETNDINPWIQAEFGTVKEVSGVITQGRDDALKWVTSFEVHYSIDGSNFEPILGASGEVQDFIGNVDQNTPVTNIFSETAYAQFIRIYPTSLNNEIGLRFEVIGCAEICPGVEFHDACYTFKCGNNDFVDLVNKCDVSDANVVSIHSLEEANIVRQFVIDSGYNNAYIGLLTDETNSYYWTDGSEVDYMYNSTDLQIFENQRCHIIDAARNYEWEEQGCDVRYCGICKKQVPTTVAPTTLTPTTVAPTTVEATTVEATTATPTTVAPTTVETTTVALTTVAPTAELPTTVQLNTADDIHSFYMECVVDTCLLQESGLYTIPTDSVVRFSINNDIVDIYVSWNVADANNEIVNSVANESSIMYTFTKSGLYNIEMILSGAEVETDVSVKKQLLVVRPIGGISVVEGPRVDVFENKTFNISFLNTGYGACVVVDFGNGHSVRYGNKSCSGFTMIAWMGNLTSNFKVSTVCQERLSYNMIVYGLDQFSYEKVNFIYAIAPKSLDCNVPIVNIFDSHTDPANPRKLEFSQDIMLEAEVLFDCQTSKNQKSWSVERVSPGTDSTINGTLQNVDTETFGDKVYDSGPLTLVLKRKALRIGFYRFKLVVSMESMLTSGAVFSAFKEEYVEITASHLHVKLIDGDSKDIRIGHGDTLTLSPQLFSRDPDVSQDDEQAFESFSYYCRQTTEEFNVTNGGGLSLLSTNRQNGHFSGCFGSGPGKLIWDAGIFTLDTSLMRSNLDYVMMVVIRKGTRVGESSIVVRVRDGNLIIPVINVNVQPSAVNGVLQLNPSADIRTSGVVADIGDADLQFNWNVIRKEFHDSVYETIEDLTTHTYGQQTDSFFISKSLMLSDLRYTDYKITLSVNSSQRSGSSSLEFTINLPPSGGVCLLSSHSLVVLEPVLVNCTGWLNIVQYSYSMKKSNDSIPRSLQSGREAVQTIYPLEGHPDKDYMVEIWVNIENRLGVSIDFMVDIIQVRPLEVTSDESDELLNDLQEMTCGNRSIYAELLAEGNWKTISEHASRNAVLLNNIGAIQVVNASQTAEELEESRIRRANIRMSIVELLANSSIPPVPSSVTDRLGLLTTVTEKTDEINQDTIGLMVKTIERLIENIEFFQDDTEENKVLNGATQALSVIGNVLEGSSFGFSNALNGSGSDPVRAGQQVAELDKLFDRLVNIAMKGRSRHEPPITISTTTFTLSMKRLSVRDLDQNSLKAGGGQFNVPPCEVLLGEELCSQENDIDLQVKETFSNPYNFGKSVKRISSDSKLLSLSFAKEDGVGHTVENIREPIEIIVPRKTAQVIQWQDVNADPINEKFRMYHRVDIANSDTSITIDFQPHCINTTYEITLAHEDYPDSQNNIFVEMIYATKNVEGYVYRIFISSSIIGPRTGVFYLGVAEIIDDEEADDGSSSSSSVFIVQEDVLISETFTCNYSVRIFVSGCNFWNKEEETWSSSGCKVGPETSVSYTQCLCTHLTTFASSFIIPPAPLDFDYIFANADFLDNIAIYVTSIVIYVLFILIFIWARRKDKQDEEMVGMVPLADNEINDRYFYEVTVLTADIPSAATKSKVSLIVSGSNGDTGVRTFDKIKRPIFKRGAVDKFLLSTSRDIGTLEAVRVWHDNSGEGKYQSWFLHSIILRNIITGEVYNFLFNNWLSLTNGDGLVVRSSLTASTSEMKAFSNLFGGHARKAIRDDHLWFSIFLRPPVSTFTRLQRAVCCMMVIWLEMLVNIMWYKSVPPPEATKSISLGPIKITTAEIGVGIMSNLIVFPVSILIIAVFRKARSRTRSSVFTEIIQQRKKVNDVNANLDGASELDNVVVSESYSDTKMNEKNYGVIRDNSSSLRKRKKLRKKKRKTFPWWVIIPAWTAAVCTILVSTLFVIFYAIQMGNEEAWAWLTSLCVSIFAGIVFTQPIKGLVIAVIFASVCKLQVQDSDDEDNEDDIPDELEENIEQVDGQAVTNGKHGREDVKVNTNSPNKNLKKEELQHKRKQRLYEKKLDSILQEIFFHLIFVFVAFIICYAELDSNAHRYKYHLENTFVKASSFGVLPFENLSHPGNFWLWMRKIFLPGVYAPSISNNSYLDNSDDIMADEMSYILGYPVIRQLRVKPDLCSLHETVANIFNECNIGYSVIHEDMDNYGPHWTTFNESHVSKPFTYRNASEINGYPFVARHAIYSGGGYILKMKGRMTKIVKNLDFLFNTRWFDKYTRAVFIELFLYNPQVNLFASVILVLEVLPTGGSYPYYRIDVIRLLSNADGFRYIVIICNAVYFIFTLSFIFNEFRKIFKEKKKYFLQVSNVLEFLIMFFTVFSVILFIMRIQIVNSIHKEIEEKEGSGHVNLALAVYFNDIFTCLLGFILFFGTLKFLKLLRFNQYIAIFFRIFQSSAKDLISFFIFLSIAFLAYSSLFYLTFSVILHDYASFFTAVESIINTVMGNFDVKSITSANRILGPIYLFSLLTCFVFLFFNMFLAIIMDAYEVMVGGCALQITASNIWEHLKKKCIKKINTCSEPIKDVENDNENDVTEKHINLQNSIDMLHIHVTQMFQNELEYCSQIEKIEKCIFASNKCE